MENIALYNDQFSWRRMLSVGYMYRDSIRIHIPLTIAISVLSSCLILFAGSYEAKKTLLILGNSIMGLALYFNPLVFARHDDSLMRQLPVKPIEKWTFYMLYCLVFIPIIIQGIWYGLSAIFSFFGKGISIEDMFEMGMKMSGSTIGDCDYLSPGSILFIGTIQSAFYVLIMLYIVLKGGRHKVLKAILCYVIVILITGLVSGIAGFVIAVKDAFDNPDMAKEDLASSIIDQLMPLMYALSGVYLIASAILARKSYNLLAKGQVKN